MKIKKVIKAIKGHKRFLVSSHQNLEGDAIGSMFALARLLEQLGKEVHIFSPEPFPPIYKFLRGTKKVKYRPKGEKLDYDAACILDCTDLGRLGCVINSMDLKKPIINIDHHASNTKFGTTNWIEPDLSCTGEQVYYLFKEAGASIDKTSALFIYIAVLTDTGSFRYSNTSAITHKIAAELISKGLNPAAIYRKIYEQTHRSRVALLSSALSTMNMTKDGKIAWIRVTRDMLKKYKTGIEGTEEFVNFPRSIKGVKIALAFREIDRDTVKVGFRSNDYVDVSNLAKLFGGGGHPSASGCTFKGTMGEAEEAVLLKARKFV